MIKARSDSNKILMADEADSALELAASDIATQCSLRIVTLKPVHSFTFTEMKRELVHCRGRCFQGQGCEILGKQACLQTSINCTCVSGESISFVPQYESEARKSMIHEAVCDFDIALAKIPIYPPRFAFPSKSPSPTVRLISRILIRSESDEKAS